MMTIVAYAVGGVWITTLLIAMLLTKKSRGFRAAQVVAMLTTLAFAVIWSRALFNDGSASTSAKTEAARAAGASCASVEPGQAEESIRARLGEPSEVKDEAELRGPGAKAWVYRDSRCAVHLLEGVVESVD